LIPLIAMGIPGSVIDVILLGALVMHGLQAGPLLFQNNPEVVYTIMTAALCANLAMFVLMLAGIGAASRLVKVRRAYLVPAILVFCFIGAYATSNRMFDVWVMLAFGVIGFGMERMRLPLAPFVIGYVLAPIAEHNLSAALMLSAGDYSPLVTRPISLVFLLVSAALLFWPLAQRWRQRAR
jgi:putative tricarboxylic transport membrane protein